MPSKEGGNRPIFNQERALNGRDNFKLNRIAALAEWRQLGAAKGTASLSFQRLVRIRRTTPVVCSVFTLGLSDLGLDQVKCPAHADNA